MPDYYSKHFKKSEFACRCGKCKYSTDPEISRELIVALEMIRSFCKSKNPKAYISITSGRRCREYNASIKNAAKNSKHIYGVACDFMTPHVKTSEVFRYIDTLFPQEFGLSLYSNPNRIHLDVRKGRGRW